MEELLNFLELWEIAVIFENLAVLQYYATVCSWNPPGPIDVSGVNPRPGPEQ
jgi:hypothetical protein